MKVKLNTRIKSIVEFLDGMCFIGHTYAIA